MGIEGLEELLVGGWAPIGGLSIVDKHGHWVWSGWGFGWGGIGLGPECLVDRFLDLFRWWLELFQGIVVESLPILVLGIGRILGFGPRGERGVAVSTNFPVAIVVVGLAFYAT